MGRQGEPDDVRVAPLHGRDEASAARLDRVRPCRVERLASPDVGLDLRVRIVAHRHLGAHDRRPFAARAGVHDRHAGQDLVPPVAETAQHPDRLRRRAGLSQDRSVDDDERVGAEHDGVGDPAGDGAGLGQRERHDDIGGRPRGRSLVDCARQDPEPAADLAEELPAPGRRRRQHELQARRARVGGGRARR